jgi:hypothetical protein
MRNMAYRIVLLAAPLLLSAAAAFAQELVPNGSFEDVLQCPNGPSQLAGTAFWFDPTGNLTGTPDFFHACGSGTHTAPANFLGFQEPAEGDGYAGIFLYEGSQVLANWREYVQVELLETMVQDRCYHVRVKANLSDNSSRTTNALGLRFYPEAVFLPNPFAPGDEPHLELPAGTFLNTTDWTLLEGDYLAAGGERFLMIGNYRDNANTTVQQLSTNGNFAYAFIDAISVVPCIPTDVPALPASSVRIQLNGRSIELHGIDPGATYRITDRVGRQLRTGGLAEGRIELGPSLRDMVVLSVYEGSSVRHFTFILP